jgi:hypothetical protein
MNTARHAQPGAAAHLSQTELARRWQMSPRSLEKWRTLGIGPAYLKIGGAVRYRTEDVLAYEAAQLRGGR